MTERGDDGETTPAELEAHAQLKLIKVQLTKLVGELASDSGEERVLDDISVEIRGQYRFVHDAVIQFRWNAELPIRETTGRNLAYLEVALDEWFHVPPGPRPSPEALSVFMRKSALDAAMPHIREGLRGLSQRLGIGSLALGFTRNDGDGPHAALQAGPGPTLDQRG
ncbi:hypothetical protein O7627_35210 [Solwaraspora sp. WMMD1047]|uniref:hypothetical protein n=1 Tax=Solwaraspora sp. WMMD1047 TaxID=3016102 RepID=UPI0024167D4B|nr:hypothetical protein [Solwaraspora sp. WMMD1047]MDG4834520.1 hypothetical protein [Solwaraspora sp. WMMD1047]